MASRRTSARDPRESRELLRVAAVDAISTFPFVLTPSSLISDDDGGSALTRIAVALVAAVALAALDVARTRRRWRREGGMELRLEIRAATESGVLPADADPERWTSPVAQRLRDARTSPWLFGFAAVGLPALALVGLLQHHHLGSLTTVVLAVDEAGLILVAVAAVRDRIGPRAAALSRLLIDLDDRAIARSGNRPLDPEHLQRGAAPEVGPGR